MIPTSTECWLNIESLNSKEYNVVKFQSFPWNINRTDNCSNNPDRSAWNCNRWPTAYIYNFCRLVYKYSQFFMKRTEWSNPLTLNSSFFRYLISQEIWWLKVQQRILFYWVTQKFYEIHIMLFIKDRKCHEWSQNLKMVRWT